MKTSVLRIEIPVTSKALNSHSGYYAFPISPKSKKQPLSLLASLWNFTASFFIVHTQFEWSPLKNIYTLHEVSTWRKVVGNQNLEYRFNSNQRMQTFWKLK